MDQQGTFSVEGRPAPGLYLLAWLLSVGGFALFVMAQFMSAGIAAVFVVVGMAILGLGLAAACGYQVLARSHRDASAYRGPSPLLVFGLQIVITNLLFAALAMAGLPDPRTSPAAFAMVGTTLLLGYVVVVSVFVVRTGGLTWREIRVTRGGQVSTLLTDAGYGALLMATLWIPITLFAALLATLLQTQTVDIVPNTGGSVDLLLTIFAGAVLVPIGEEIFFRGFALTAWLKDLGPRTALVRSTIFFALVHVLNINVEPGAAFDGAKQALLTVAVIAPVGLALGWIFMRRGLVASIAGHATFNLIGVVLLSLAQNFPTPQ